MDAHAKKIEELLVSLGTSERGLTLAAVAERRERFGSNELPEQRRVTSFSIFVRQLHSWFIYILFAAAGISFVFQKVLDGLIILGIIVVNALIGYFEESRAESAIRALSSLIVPKAKALRDGITDVIEARELVPGDIVVLQAGDRVPADARIIHCRELKTQEASLTGESFSVEKNSHVVAPETAFADRSNMVWTGTLVVNGSATVVVVAIGAETMLGQIARTVSQADRSQSHFRWKTNQLAMQLGVIACIAALATFVLGAYLKHLPLLEVFVFSIATLVSSIPEGLPAVLAVVLAIGAFRMARQNAIIRHLPVIEDLAVTSVIITDKTGTLTQNSMTARVLATVERDFEVSGEGWSASGMFYHNREVIDAAHDPVLKKLLMIAVLCNNASVHLEGERYEVVGDPTEASFVVLAEKAGFTKETTTAHSAVLDHLPFAQETRVQSVLVARPERELYVIGGEERILASSHHYLGLHGIQKMSAQDKERLLERFAGMTRQAMRVVACAYRKVPAKTKRISAELYQDLVFVGLIGIVDPLRPNVDQVIAAAQRAGIRVIMATGDHAETAIAIGRSLGLLSPGDHRIQVSTEEELRSLSPQQLADLLKKQSVFARMTPDMKMRLIETLQRSGKVVAMIGDGVNDAPALKTANVGIAMGTIGTDVAREASDIILQDDNFGTLLKAIEQGRLIFTNIRSTSFFMITTSIAEIVTILASIAIGSALPLTALQILWINFITDGIPNIALAAEGEHDSLMEAQPRPTQERILSRSVMPFLLIVVIIMSFVTVGAFLAFIPYGLAKAQTIAFALMIFFQLFNALNMRSLDHSLFRIGIFSNFFMTAALVLSFALQLIIMLTPALRSAFGLAALSGLELAFTLLAPLSVIAAVELYKFARNAKNTYT